jgi:plasmid stabilization system protein ParE
MTKYSILYTAQARIELLSVVDYIEKELYAPIAAERFYYGIKSTIEKLKENADIYKISDRFAITSKYASNARRIN